MLERRAGESRATVIFGWRTSWAVGTDAVGDASVVCRDKGTNCTSLWHFAARLLRLVLVLGGWARGAAQTVAGVAIGACEEEGVGVQNCKE